MGQLFNMDNPVWQAMGRLADIMILSLLWLVCSIPIVTIGASTTALYYVTLKIAEKREGYIARGFFKSFKENFLQATAIWLIILAVSVITYIDIRFFGAQDSTIGTIATVFFYAVGIVLFVVNLYIYPILARFVNNIRRTFLNTALMAFGSPLCLLWSIAVVVLVVIVAYTVPAFMIFAPGAIAYLTSFPISKVLAKYMPPEETEEEIVEEAEEQEENVQ